MTRSVVRRVLGAFHRFVLLVSILAAVGCSRPDQEVHRFTRFAMGTVVEYAVVGLPEEDARLAVQKAHAELERVAGLLWEGDEHSEIFAINASCGVTDVGQPCSPIAVSDETEGFLTRALEYAGETEGHFDITVGSFLGFYDFTADTPKAPDTGTIHRLSVDLGERTLILGPNGLSGLKSGVQIAVGGVAKGYAVDRAVEILREAGIRGALVNAGGDLYCLGKNGDEPWRIGIRDPDDPGSVIAALEVADAAVATSGDYQQYFEVDGTRYHHLLDPTSGLPAQQARSATIIAVSAERADALATGLFVAGPDGIDWVESADNTEGLLMAPGGQLVETSGFDAFRASD